MKTRLAVALFLAAWIAAFISVRPAYAYLDPGTGSFLFQLIIGAAAAGLFLLKVYWKKVRGLFSRNDEESDDDEL